MRPPLRFAVTVAPLVGLLFTVRCTDATGSVQGGAPLTSQAACTPTWTSLYATFFGPAGQASCSAQASCHGAASQSGAMTSGFVCGSSKEECWEGMTKGINPVDAGGVFCPIVCTSEDAGGAGCPQNSSFSCPSDPTQQSLIIDLHKASGGGLNNMPCAAPLDAGADAGVLECLASQSAYTFTSDDLACITTWIQQGAQDN
jgi:hypothetical protein